MVSLPLAEGWPAVATTPELDDLLRAGAPVAVGVSGGKDSVAAALAVSAHLDAVKHQGPRILIHADLGVVEWADSLPTCERLAAYLGYELVVVRRPQGDMMARWEQRWRDNLKRYVELSCVKLILPWSTAAMRYCTAEMKVDQITRFLARLWPNAVILNVTGIRRAESANRAKTPVLDVCDKLEKKSLGTTGYDWCPLVDWSEADVYAIARAHGFAMHEAYERFGSSRVSCVMCILGSRNDHLAALKDERNHAVIRRMADLEIASTFKFQDSRWLCETAWEVLTDKQRARFVGLDQGVRERAKAREDAEAAIPPRLLYKKGWPTAVPGRTEAELLAKVRKRVLVAVDVPAPQWRFVAADDVRARYQELIQLKTEREARRGRTKRRAAG